MELPAESAAKEWNMDFDLFLRDLERGRQRLRGSGRMLDRRPELTRVALHIGRGIERFHRSMRNEWYFIHRLNFLRSGVECLIDVAVVSNLFCCLTFGELVHLVSERSRTNRCSRSIFPFDHKRVATFDGRPCG